MHVCMLTPTCSRTADGPVGLCSFLFLGLQFIQAHPGVKGIGRAVHGHLHGDGGFRPADGHDTLRLLPLFGSRGLATGVVRVIVAVAHVIKAKVLDLVFGAADYFVSGAVAILLAVKTKQVRLGFPLGFTLRGPHPAGENAAFFSAPLVQR